MNTTMLNPNPRMLVRIAQGDAFGVAVEYLKLPRDQSVYECALKIERYVQHPTHSLKAGQYSDDTQMSIAVSEVLLEGGEFTRERFADAFVRCFKRDERDGYARSFQAFLEEIESGADFLKYIHPDSDKNGAAMRAVPIGVLPSPSEVVTVADLQAKITHNTTMGRESAIFVALMSHFALYTDEPFSGLRAFLARHRPHVRLSEEKVLWDGPVVGPNVGWNTTMAVLTLLEAEENLLDITKRAIIWGGDVDSVLAITWGIASTRMHHELPMFFDDGLENGTYGRHFLADLGARLMEKYTA